MGEGKLRGRWWVLLGYLGLSLLLTWPLVAHFGSRAPGDGIDDPSLAWNLWWARHALVNQPQNPFAGNWIFWPIGINLAFYTLTLLNGILSIPLQLVFGVVPAYNILLLSSFVLGGYGAYLLCLETGRLADWKIGRLGNGGITRYAAFLAGALYAFASAKMFYAALGQGNVASSQWAPFAALYLVRAARSSGRLRDAGLAALFLVLQAYAEQTYASFLVIFAGVAFGWGVARGIKPARRLKSAPDTQNPINRIDAEAGCAVIDGSSGQVSSVPGLVARFTLIAALFAAGLVPFLVNMLPDLRAEGDFFSAGGGFADVFSADLAGYALPTQLHPLLGSLTRAVAAQEHFPVDKGQQIYPGYTALALALVGVVAWRTRIVTAYESLENTLVTGRRSSLTPALPAPPRYGVIKGLAERAKPDESGWTRDDRVITGIFSKSSSVVGSVPQRLKPLLGVMMAARVGPGPWFWALCAALFFLLTLGPTLRVAGHDTGLPLPFALVAQLPFFKGNRYPSRYGVMLLLSLAPLVALGARHVMRRVSSATGPGTSEGSDRSDGSRVTSHGSRPPRRLTRYAPHATFCVLLALLLFEHLSIPLPTFDLAVPDLYRWVAQQPGDFALLELPPGWRNGARVLGKQDVVIMQEMWYQTVHGKRLLGGNTSRNPDFKFQYFAEDPTLSRLIAQTNAADLPQHAALRERLASQPVTEADRAQARAWAGFLKLRYVMVHRDKAPAETEALLRALLPVSLVREDGPLALYALPSDLPAPNSFDLGTDAGRMAMGEGWNPPDRSGVNLGEQRPALAERKEVRLLLPLDSGATRVSLYGWAAGEGQRASLVVDGLPVGETAMSTKPGWLAFDVPANEQRPPVSDVRIRFTQLWPVRDAEARWPVESGPPFSGGQFSDILLVRSAGAETGDFAHIYVNGHELSPNARGYNLVALPRSEKGAFGTLDLSGARTASFDTHLDPEASARLARWVEALPMGAVVLGAVRDEGSMNLGPEAVQGLASLGVSGDLRGHFRWGHAFIGIKGAQPGTALEALDGVRTAQVATGIAVDAPEIAAAVTEVKIGK